mmetsp:Transcript_1499/g.2938  ORF Transcript_1499/g.2938 Transcript_1499/m.2938 type:complete len:296 (+) Transcript_1499:775-1662(+)
MDHHDEVCHEVGGPLGDVADQLQRVQLALPHLPADLAHQRHGQLAAQLAVVAHQDSDLPVIFDAAEDAHLRLVAHVMLLQVLESVVPHQGGVHAILGPASQYLPHAGDAHHADQGQALQGDHDLHQPELGEVGERAAAVGGRGHVRRHVDERDRQGFAVLRAHGREALQQRRRDGRQQAAVEVGEEPGEEEDEDSPGVQEDAAEGLRVARQPRRLHLRREGEAHGDLQQVEEGVRATVVVDHQLQGQEGDEVDQEPRLQVLGRDVPPAPEHLVFVAGVGGEEVCHHVEGEEDRDE